MCIHSYSTTRQTRQAHLQWKSHLLLLHFLEWALSAFPHLFWFKWQVFPVFTHGSERAITLSFWKLTRPLGIALLARTFLLWISYVFPVFKVVRNPLFFHGNSISCFYKKTKVLCQVLHELMFSLSLSQYHYTTCKQESFVNIPQSYTYLQSIMDVVLSNCLHFLRQFPFLQKNIHGMKKNCVFLTQFLFSFGLNLIRFLPVYRRSLVQILIWHVECVLFFLSWFSFARWVSSVVYFTRHASWFQKNSKKFLLWVDE